MEPVPSGDEVHADVREVVRRQSLEWYQGKWGVNLAHPSDNGIDITTRTREEIAGACSCEDENFDDIFGTDFEVQPDD